MLRGGASVAVVIHHTLEAAVLGGTVGWKSPDWLTTSGAAGVDIFFAISGFIMLYVSFPLGQPPDSPWAFLYKRITRVYPLYWFCCFVILVFGAAGLFKSETFSLSVVVKSFFLLPIPNTLLGVSWTLSYEIYFYLIFALTLPFKSRSLSVIICTFVIVVLNLLGNLMPGRELHDFIKNPIAVEFCFGLFTAWAFVWYQHRTPIPAPWGLLGCAALVAAPLFVFHSGTDGLPGFPRVIAWGIPATFVLVSVLWTPPPRTAGTRFAVLLSHLWSLRASHSVY
jgi:exopolysaccharide production protein ExoZ